jgi:CcmD family protein
MENLEYLVAAYSVIWLAISIYVLILYRRQRRLRQEIDSLKEKVSKKGADGER